MEMIKEAILEWLREILVGGIVSNLSGMFDNVNQRVGEISTQVGTTPAAWNGTIYSMVRNLSESVILPIAGVILAFVMTLELIQMVTEKNNMHGDIDTFMFFNHKTNININNRIVNFDIKELGKQLKKIGMLIVQDAVWNRVTINREARKSTRYYIDEFHLLLKEEQTAAYSVEIWKRFRKWGGIPTGITQNVKDLLSSREVENIFENSDYVYMLNQASGDRQILAKQLNISPHQLSYVTHSGEGEGLLFYGSVILPFVDRFPKDTELYRAMTTKLSDLSA